MLASLLSEPNVTHADVAVGLVVLSAIGFALAVLASPPGTLARAAESFRRTGS